MKHFPEYSFFFAVCALWACHPLPAPTLDIAPPSETVYVISRAAGYQFQIASKVINRSNAVVYLDRCNYTVQVLDETQWRTVDGAICGGDLGSWIIRPGDSLEITITVYDDRSYQSLWRRGPLQSGKYRLKFGGKCVQPDTFRSKRRSSGFYNSAPFDLNVQSTPPPDTR